MRWKHLSVLAVMKYEADAAGEADDDKVRSESIRWNRSEA